MLYICTRGKTASVFNKLSLLLQRTKDGKPEIDFETDVTDFRLPLIQNKEIKKGQSRSGSMPHEQNLPEIQYSLRVRFYLKLTLHMLKSDFHGRALSVCSQAYLSILYLKPRTQIFLRGKKNIPRLIMKGLNYVEHDVYNPHFSVSLYMEGIQSLHVWV